MSFNTIAADIVKKSIRSAICIDDEFAEPYEELGDGVEVDIPKELYQSFRNDGNCSLDFYRYKNEEQWDLNHQNVLSNRDLIVLDWELEKEEPKYKITLKILESIINHDTNQFVIIYTHSQDLYQVILNIQAYYSNTNSITIGKEIDLVIESFEETGRDFKEFETVLKKSIPRNEIFNNQFDIENELIKIGFERKEFGGFIAKAKRYLKVTNNQEVLEFILLNVYQLADFCNTTSRIIERVESDQIILSINNTIVLISNKDTEGADAKKILPANLFNSFSQAITSKPSNAMALMACEMKDIFRSNVALIGNNIPNIDEKAFYCHWNNLRKEEDVVEQEADDQFKYFLLQTWLNELSQFTIKTSKNCLFFDALLSYGNEKAMFDLKNEDTPIDELIKLGAHYSTISVDISQRADKKVQFGDIFWLKKNHQINEVLLSITPHCDSFRPDKIRNMLHFIKGQVVNSDEDKKTALENSENDFYSFIKFNENPLCIKWLVKPFTIYVKKENNDVSKLISVNLRDITYKLEIIASLKENYTQRIANQSFSYAMRVGITLPTLKN